MEDRKLPQERRVAFWITMLAPVAMGLVAGVMRLAFPGLSSDGAEVPPGERMWSPVLAGLVVAMLLQVGRWWLQRRSLERAGEGVKTLGAVSLLVVLCAAGLAALMDPGALWILLPLLFFVGFLWWWPRKKIADPRQRLLGIYCVCDLCFLDSAILISMALSPIS
ncbi:hypothetical protein [Arthrobacter sp.]|uniref:hypothetical protein n=1 Tax=Arthrobacter sp. TaxID=1667 RepID=UPI003A92AC89